MEVAQVGYYCSCFEEKDLVWKKQTQCISSSKTALYFIATKIAPRLEGETNRKKHIYKGKQNL